MGASGAANEPDVPARRRGVGRHARRGQEALQWDSWPALLLEPVNTAVEGAKVQLAIGAFAEGGDVARLCQDPSLRQHGVALRPQRPEVAGHEVGIHVGADQARQTRPAVDVAADDAGALLPSVLQHRIDERYGRSAALELVATLAEPPAIVAAADDAVDLFPTVLPHVAGP